MKQFRLTIDAIGYESTSLVVEAATMSEASKWENSQRAFRKFAEHNAISMSDAKGFGWLTTTKIK